MSTHMHQTGGARPSNGHTSHHVLRIDASSRRDGSTSRALADQALERLSTIHGPLDVTARDLADGLPLIDETWIAANSTAADQRTAAQRETLRLSDTLIDELKAADTVLIALPVYNFSVPASFKAWIDLVCRARVTFRYSENGPVGLLEGKRALVVFVSGGTRFGAPIDFAGDYIRHILGFIGITDVDFITADRLFSDNGRLAAAQAQIAAYDAQAEAA